MSDEHSTSVSTQSVGVTAVENADKTSDHGNNCSWERSKSGCTCPELPLMKCHNFDSCGRFAHRLCMDAFEKQKSSDATAVTIGENMIICMECHPWNQSTSQIKEKKKRITKDETEKLRQFFKEQGWPRNRNLPKANGNAAVDKIIKDLGLERSQVSYQLAKWKKDTYDKAQLQLLIEPEKIAESIEENMSMSIPDFVDYFLGLMIEGDEIDGNANTTNLIQSLELQPEKELKKKALKFIKGHKDHVCFQSLTCLLDDLIKAMAEELPTKASMISSMEMTFASRKEEGKKTRIQQWKRGYIDMPTHGDDNARFDERKFAYFGMYVAECLFFVWIHSAAVADLPPVQIPRANLVGAYSLPVIYYVAGWTLQRVSLAKTVAKSKRAKYQQFYPLHNRGIDYAKNEGLPYKLVQMREKQNLFYVSREYFEFICLIESTYVKNLTMKMMMAYNDGNLLQIIDCAIFKSEDVRQKFFVLFGNNSNETEKSDCEMEQEEEDAATNNKNIDGEGEGNGDGEEEQNVSDKLEVLRFILDRYIRMRGCWFVKALRDNDGEKSLGTKKLAAAPTNMKVAHLAIQSKTVANALRDAAKNAQGIAKDEEREKLLWNQAAEEVLGYSDEEDEEEEEEEEEEDVEN